jgi:poly(3-hydroxyalkanoate) depolymerase
MRRPQGLPGAAGPSRRATPPETSVEFGHAEVGGLRLRYARSHGTGAPLLLCNGIGANLEMTLPLVRALRGIPVVLFDLPGTGNSASAWFWPTFRAYARLAVGLMDAIGHAGRFSVAGVSWGGGLAQQIARDHPLRVQCLVLMATTFGPVLVPGRARALARMLTPQRYLSRGYMARHAGTLYGGAMVDRPDLAVALARSTRVPSTLAYAQQLLAAMQFTSLLWLHQIRCPALVLTGSDDPIIRPLNGRILAARLGDARLHVLPNGGHLFMVTDPEATAALIGGFIGEARGGAAE